MWIASVVCT